MRPTQLGWTSFLVAIASLAPPNAQAAVTPEVAAPSSVEARLNRLQSALQQNNQSKTANPNSATEQPESVALGWGNGAGRRGFVNSRRGGWGDGYRGGFGNINPWRNGWRDGGGFLNRR